MRVLGRHIVFEQARFEPRDAWVGIFWTESKYGAGHVVFWCPVPFVVFRFRVTRESS